MSEPASRSGPAIAELARSVPSYAEPENPRSSQREPGRFDVIEEAIACTALIIVVAAVCWGVLTRYVTTQPAPWTGEVAGMGFAWVVFLGAAAGFKRNLHLSIDLLTRLLPKGIEQALAIVVQLGILAFAIYVVWLGVGFTQRNLTNPSPVLRLPQSIIYLAVTLGFLSIAIRQAWFLGRALLKRGSRP